MNPPNRRLVYSTDRGRITPASAVAPNIAQTDDVVRIQRESKGRGGKVVCVISGLPSAELKTLCKLLKRKCGSGGAVKGQNIEIQGDHRDSIRAILEARGQTVKFAGG